jgi:hypothetical protein
MNHRESMQQVRHDKYEHYTKRCFIVSPEKWEYYDFSLRQSIYLTRISNGYDILFYFASL